MARLAPQMKNLWHKDLADWLLVNGGKPGWNKAASQHFGVSGTWLSTLIHSDAFQDYFGRRRAEMSDVQIFSARERMLGTLDQTIDLIQEKLEKDGPTLPLNALLDTADLLAKRTGHSDGSKGGPDIQNNILLVTREELEESRARMRGAGAKPILALDSQHVIEVPGSASSTKESS